MLIAVLNGTNSDVDVTLTACKLGRESKDKITLLHVIEIERDYPLDKELPDKTARGEGILANMEKLTKKLRVSAKGELLQARSLGAGVVSHASDENAEIIVIGLPDFPKYGDYKIGDDLTYILSNAQCRVVTCRAFSSNGKS